ncbi:MAG: O-antigen ligase family protein [Bacteroidota bacterium]
MNSIKSSQIHHLIFIFGVSLLAISLPTSKFGMSLAQLILAANWLLDKRVIQKFIDFFTNKIAVAFALLFFVHVLWLLNTSSFQYALDDLRTKAPIFILAVIFSTTSRLSSKEFMSVMLLHAFSVLLMSFISTYLYVVERPVDFRLISPYISHIRLALNVCIASFTLVYLIFKSLSINTWVKLLFALISIWFVFFLSLLQSVTGLIIFFVMTIILSIYFIKGIKIRKPIKLSIITFICLIPLISIIYVINVFSNFKSKPDIDFSKLDSISPYGGKYIHDTISYPTEDGKWIGLYLCEVEVQHAWNLKSKIKYNSKDSKGNVINYAILRYLTSMNLRKDFDGVNQLSNDDVANIEKGIASVEYVRGIGVKSRLHKIFWEYQSYNSTGDIKGHSLFQRFELWDASLEIIKTNWLFGVGTGDVPLEFKKQLIHQNSPLKETRMRSHNQYLSLFIAFGIFGFLLSLFSFIYPFVQSKLHFDYFCMIFLIVCFMSMLTEDTIESQDGVTFYAFFGALYLFQKPLKKRLE